MNTQEFLEKFIPHLKDAREQGLEPVEGIILNGIVGIFCPPIYSNDPYLQFKREIIVLFNSIIDKDEFTNYEVFYTRADAERNNYPFERFVIIINERNPDYFWACYELYLGIRINVLQSIIENIKPHEQTSFYANFVKNDFINNKFEKVINLIQNEDMTSISSISEIKKRYEIFYEFYRSGLSGGVLASNDSFFKNSAWRNYKSILNFILENRYTLFTEFDLIKLIDSETNYYLHSDESPQKLLIGGSIFIMAYNIAKRTSLSEKSIQKINSFIVFLKDNGQYDYSYERNFEKLDRLVTTLNVLGSDDGNKINSLNLFFKNESFFNSSIPSDPWGSTVLNYLNTQIPEGKKLDYFYLLEIASKIGSDTTLKPKAAKELKKLIENIGQESYWAFCQAWIKAVKDFPEDNIRYFINNDVNKRLLRGFVYSLCFITSPDLPREVAKLAEILIKSISEAAANSCAFVLAEIGCNPNSTDLELKDRFAKESASWLSRLLVKSPTNKFKTIVENQLNRLAENLKITTEYLEDICTSDFGFEAGKRRVDFDEYSAVLELVMPNKIQMVWEKINHEGSSKIQKSEPATVKNHHSTALKQLKQQLKDAEKMIPVLKQRLDGHYLNKRRFTYAHFSQYYLNHGIMAVMSRKLIWQIAPSDQTLPNGSLENAINVIYINGNLQDINGTIITPQAEDIVQLWHPLYSPIDDIMVWRTLVSENLIVQPFKQAYREVYILTEAEIRTQTYSNRYAAHILKQHQFVALLKSKNWRGQLIGAYDDGIDNTFAHIELKAYGLEAQLWYQSVDQDDQYNEAGIWNYVSTDQVRFLPLKQANTPEDPLFLIDIPAIVFSEIFRHCDMFVGVASVGADPLWRDNGGLPQFHTYWESHSFGELSITAQTRKDILSKLVPKLKIANVCTMTDKFLVVKGKLRTYKIHLGSGNILMEPNDQYLCIVADRNAKNSGKNSGTFFIPFEGDSTLSVILSKAFLLADDDKIKDVTITHQLVMR